MFLKNWEVGGMIVLLKILIVYSCEEYQESMSLVTAKYDIYHFIFPCSKESFVRGDYIIRNYGSQNRKQNILGGKKWQKEMS